MNLSQKIRVDRPEKSESQDNLGQNGTVLEGTFGSTYPYSN